MSNERPDALENAYRLLDRIADLKAKSLLSEDEFEDIRRLVVAGLKRMATESSATADLVAEARVTAPTLASTIPFGQLHDLVVRKIDAGYDAGKAPPKQRILHAMAEMGERRALNPGDSELVARLVDVVYEPEDWDGDPPMREVAPRLLGLIASVDALQAKIKERPESSATAHAIAGTVQQSCMRMLKEHAEPRTPVIPAAVANASGAGAKSLWRKLVLTDVDGAFQGGAAGAAIAPAFGPALPMAMPIAAALGVVIGAGVRSGLAYGERTRLQ